MYCIIYIDRLTKDVIMDFPSIPAYSNNNNQHDNKVKPNQTSENTSLRQKIINLFKSKPKDLEIFHLGGINVAAHDPASSGKNLYAEGYFYERIPVHTDSGHVHIYGNELKPHVHNWMAETKEKQTLNKKTENFQEYMSRMDVSDSLSDKKVRQFNDEDRTNTQIHFKDGKLSQIGLDNSSKDTSPLKAGEYAFVIGKVKGRDGIVRDQLFAAQKNSSDKGKVQHSSFLRTGNVLSAGKFQVDSEGRIVDVNNQSGHYRPAAKELAVLLGHLNSAGYDISNLHVNYSKSVFAQGISNIFPFIKWGIVNQRGDLWLEQTGKKYLVESEDLIKAKDAAVNIIGNHGWVINQENRSGEKLLKKLNEVLEDLDKKIQLRPTHSSEEISLDRLNINRNLCKKAIDELEIQIQQS